ncbi:hypothetical protein GURASL_09410 [Geotalea uraniireducens]|uniref:Rubrerythrin family protein n=1 Tax=Geotalea uraniireducens TaxID=351604 RepID=A0ABN6VP51_9BACT|nr:VIT1/CCC1 transporter family protein [Geotalea uraniireducens]BDV42018.1 hypothetical protein GURASL_09410 [Geotalea uraniireducens]
MSQRQDDDRRDARRYLANWRDEMNSAELYERLAGFETDANLAELYRRLAAVERRHAAAWAERLEGLGRPVPLFRPSWRTVVLGRLARWLGAAAIVPTLASLEEINSHDYARQRATTEMVSTERSHARLLRQLSQGGGEGMSGSALARFEGRHRAAGGNALRAAVLGASDGLLSNFNLLMGVAGAQLASRSILLTGFAGLLAGAISMALGEWISVQSSRELYQKQLATEREEIATVPEEEVEELTLIYQARGLDEATARSLAGGIMDNQALALEVLARDELGIDPDELGGSAWEAAIASFLLFAVGAIVPVMPYLFLGGIPALVASAAASTAGLFLLGAAITLFTGRSVVASGCRQVLFGLSAAAVTFLVGRLIGVSIAG